MDCSMFHNPLPFGSDRAPRHAQTLLLEMNGWGNICNAKITQLVVHCILCPFYQDFPILLLWWSACACIESVRLLTQLYFESYKNEPERIIVVNLVDRNPCHKRCHYIETIPMRCVCTAPLIRSIIISHINFTGEEIRTPKRCPNRIQLSFFFLFFCTRCLCTRSMRMKSQKQTTWNIVRRGEVNTPHTSLLACAHVLQLTSYKNCNPMLCTDSSTYIFMFYYFVQKVPGPRAKFFAYRKKSIW